MATTSPDNIWTPDAGDLYDLSIDLAATADSVQDALLRYRGLRVMTNAQRLALAGANLFDGLHVYTTDTDRYWIYVSGAWVDEGPRDTGWTTVPLASGFTVVSGRTPQVKVIGKVAYWRGQVQGTTSSSNPIMVAAGGVPGFARPSGFSDSGSPVSSSNGAVEVSLTVDTAGAVFAASPTSAVRNFYLKGLSGYTV